MTTCPSRPSTWLAVLRRSRRRRPRWPRRSPTKQYLGFFFVYWVREREIYAGFGVWRGGGFARGVSGERLFLLVMLPAHSSCVGRTSESVFCCVTLTMGQSGAWAWAG